jgi:hypothetical protein
MTGTPKRYRPVHLGELYRQGYVACHFHLGIYVPGQAHSHDLCADFQVALPEGGSSAVGELEIGGGLGREGVVVDRLGLSSSVATSLSTAPTSSAFDPAIDRTRTVVGTSSSHEDLLSRARSKILS